MLSSGVRRRWGTDCEEGSSPSPRALRQAETGRRSALAYALVRALEVADWMCQDSLIRGDAAAFMRQAAA